MLLQLVGGEVAEPDGCRASQSRCQSKEPNQIGQSVSRRSHLPRFEPHNRSRKSDRTNKTSTCKKPGAPPTAAIHTPVGIWPVNSVFVFLPCDSRPWHHLQATPIRGSGKGMKPSSPLVNIPLCDGAATGATTAGGVQRQKRKGA